MAAAGGARQVARGVWSGRRADGMVPAMTAAAPDVVAADVARLRADGFVVVEGLLSASDVRECQAALAPHLARERFGRNPFEGLKTQRVYTLPAIAPVFARIVAHPRVLAILDVFLQPNYLLTAAQAICIHPGEAAQALHYDDGFYPFPRPRPPVSLATIIAIDDFTAENGATDVIPGSHLWGEDGPDGTVSAADFAQASRFGHGAIGEKNSLMRGGAGVPSPEDAGLVPAVMPSGSAIVFLGTLWHRGGANRSEAPRLALSTQYCEPWARQQENYTLAIPPEVVGTFDERVQELLGYSIHPPFMGHTGGLHPKRRLHPEPA
jgi:ectoine hydroxylase-related dioxygenase (phytanoyl-CoA dioxygenase family)